MSRTAYGITPSPLPAASRVAIRSAAVPGLAVLAALRDAAGERFAWRTDPYEFIRDPIAIDLLFGSDRERMALAAGHGWRDIAAAWEPEEHVFRERRRSFLTY